MNHAAAASWRHMSKQCNPSVPATTTYDLQQPQVKGSPGVRGCRVLTYWHVTKIKRLLRSNYELAATTLRIRNVTVIQKKTKGAKHNMARMMGQ